MLLIYYHYFLFIKKIHTRKNFPFNLKKSHPFSRRMPYQFSEKSPPPGNANVATALNEQDIKSYKKYKKVYLNTQCCTETPEGNTPTTNKDVLGWWYK